jgi:hypothetical protein
VKNPIEILDCKPKTAKVVSGTTRRPRNRQTDEDHLIWLNESVIIPRLRKHFPDCALVYSYRRDIRPPASLGLAEFPYAFYLDAISSIDGEQALTRFLMVNEDATRCALVDPIETLLDTWRRLSQSPGRPVVTNASAKTEAQRRWREKKKQESN